jgi:hypothetical protein
VYITKTEISLSVFKLPKVSLQIWNQRDELYRPCVPESRYHGSRSDPCIFSSLLAISLCISLKRRYLCQFLNYQKYRSKSGISATSTMDPACRNHDIMDREAIRASFHLTDVSLCISLKRRYLCQFWSYQKYRSKSGISVTSSIDPACRNYDIIDRGAIRASFRLTDVSLCISLKRRYLCQFSSYQKYRSKSGISVTSSIDTACRNHDIMDRGAIRASFVPSLQYHCVYH